MRLQATVGSAALVASFAFLFAAPCTGATQADTLWMRDGVLVAGGPGRQGYPSALSDGAGGAFISWTDDVNGARLVRLTALGSPAPGWPAAGVQVTTGQVDFPGATLLPDGSGGAIVVWARLISSGDEIRAARYGGDGSAMSGWGAVLDSAQICAYAADDSGGLFFAHTRPGDPTAVWLSRLDSTGTAASGWATPGLRLGGSATVYDCAVTSDSAGGAFVAWTTQTPFGCHVVRVGAGGSPAPGWTSAGTQAGSISDFTDAVVVSDGAGGVYVAWNGSGDRAPFASHFTPTGSLSDGWPAGGLAVGSGGYTPGIRMVADGAGGAMLIWAGLSGVRAQHLGPLGVDPGWPAAGFVLNAESGINLGLVASQASTYLACWMWTSGAERIVAFTAAGMLAPGWSSGGVFAPVQSSETAIAPLPDGGAVFAWTDYRNDSGDIYAIRFQPDGVVAVTASLVDAVATGDAVRVRWQSDNAAARFDVERRTGASDWSVVASDLHPDGTGRLVFDDRAVAPGTRYGYRLAITEGTSRTVTGEVWVQVGVAPAFALARLSPNPATAELTLALTLPDATPARLSLLDVGGRLRRELAVSGAGEHVVRLAPLGDLAPGLYFVRLEQGARRAVTRVNLIR